MENGGLEDDWLVSKGTIFHFHHYGRKDTVDGSLLTNQDFMVYQVRFWTQKTNQRLPLPQNPVGKLKPLHKWPGEAVLWEKLQLCPSTTEGGDWIVDAKVMSCDHGSLRIFKDWVNFRTTSDDLTLKGLAITRGCEKFLSWNRKNTHISEGWQEHANLRHWWFLMLKPWFSYILSSCCSTLPMHFESESPIDLLDFTLQRCMFSGLHSHFFPVSIFDPKTTS